MEWETHEGQHGLWQAFLRYSQTHREVIASIPDGAYVLLIPDVDPIFDHESLAAFFHRTPLSPETPIAYVHLELSDVYLPSVGGIFATDRRRIPAVADVRIEVFQPHHNRSLS